MIYDVSVTQTWLLINYGIAPQPSKLSREDVVALDTGTASWIVRFYSTTYTNMIKN